MPCCLDACLTKASSGEAEGCPPRAVQDWPVMELRQDWVARRGIELAEMCHKCGGDYQKGESPCNTGNKSHRPANESLLLVLAACSPAGLGGGSRASVPVGCGAAWSAAVDAPPVHVFGVFRTQAPTWTPHQLWGHINRARGCGKPGTGILHWPSLWKLIMGSFVFLQHFVPTSIIAPICVYLCFRECYYGFHYS